MSTPSGAPVGKVDAATVLLSYQKAIMLLIYGEDFS